MMKKTIGFVAMLALFVACKENSPQTSAIPKGNDTTHNTAASLSSDAIIRNGIEVNTTGGLKVIQAFMLRGNGSLVNDRNDVKVGEMIELRILVEGWKSKNDSISLGGSEKIVANDGSSIVDVPDLFKGQPAIPLNKAQMIRMQATVTKQDKSYTYYKADFKVWNKDSDQTLTGSYKINIVP